MSRAVEGRATNAILFTDLVGSTELRGRLGEDDADRFIVAEQHRVHEVVEQAGGWVVKGMGDGVMAAFAGAADALDAAVAIQRVSAHPVRVAISIGDVSWHEGDCFGRPVVEAARLVARAEPGEVLVVDLVAVLAGGRGGHQLESLGTVELKGLAEPLAVSRVRWEAVPAEYSVAVADVAPLEVRMLGPLEILAGGIRVVGLSRRPSEVLVSLALSVGDLVTMDRLIGVLWGDDPPPRARNTVQAHVAALRRHLGVDARQLVESRTGGYRLSSSAVTDVAMFDDLCRRAAELTDDRERGDRLREALRLWRGRPVEDLEAVGFTHPALPMLEQRRLAVLESCVDADLAAGRTADVASELDLLVAEHPYNEGFVCRLALALYRMGRQTEALRAIRRLTVRLRDDVGVDMGPDVRRLEQQILTHDTALQLPVGDGRPRQELDARVSHRTPLPPLPPPLRPVPEVPFAGRTAEWSMLDRAWDAAQASRRVVVLVGGEAGAGKTRLAAEFARAAHGRGAVVLFGGADEDLDVPYQPVVEALEHLLVGVGEDGVRNLMGPGVDDLARLVPRLGKGSPVVGTDSERYQLFSAVADLLRSLCREAPALWVIDDLQWAGPATVLLLRHVLRVVPDLPLVVLATHRDDGAGRLVELSADLARLPDVYRLRLGGLDVAAVAEVVGDEALARVLVDGTGGNPFFMTELYRHLQDGGSLEHPPVSVADVIARRLGRLPADVETVLAVAAVVGMSCDDELLRAVCDDVAVDGAVDNALRSRLLEEEPGSRLVYRFPHALARAALYDRLSTRRRAQLHRDVASALERLHEDPVTVAAELARHWSLAVPFVDRETAVTWGRCAATQAADALGFQEAAAHLRRALDVAGTGAPARLRTELLIELARMLDGAGESTSSLDAAATGAELAISNGWDDLVVQAALAFPGGKAIWALNRDRRGIHLVQAGLERCQPGTPDHVCLLSKAAALTLFTAPVEQRLELVGRALDQLAAVTNPARQWQALRELDAACDPRDSDPTADRVMAELERLAAQGGGEQRFAVVEGRLRRAVRAGRGDLFRAALLDVVDEKHLSDASLALHSAYRGHVAVWDGEFEEAERLYRECWELGRREIYHSARGNLVFPRVLIGWFRGDVSRVRSDVAAFYSELGGRNLAAVHAWVELASGEPEPAERFLSEFGERDHKVMLRSTICGQGLAAASLAAARLAHRDSIAKLLAVWHDITAAVYTPGPPPALAKAYYQGILAAASSDVPTAEERLRASLVVHERLLAVPYIAASQATLADVLLAQGKREEAQCLAHQATETSSRIGAWDIARAADTVLAQT